MDRHRTSSRDLERVLFRAVGAWAAAGVLLVLATGPLYAAVALLPLGLWLIYATAGATLGILTLADARHAAGWPTRVDLALGVPAVAAALWLAARPLLMAGNAIAQWLAAI